MNLPILHVKWFIENNETTLTPIYNLTATPLIIWALITAALVLIAAFIDKKFRPKIPTFIQNLQKYKPKILYIFQCLVGISLIFASYKHTILVPHHLTESAAPTLQIIQTLAGLALIGNLALPIVAALITILYLSTIYYFGLPEALDYLNLLGIAAFLLLAKKSFNKALPILRISTGLALLILAFSEKLLYPDKAYEFLNKYPLNFMQDIGMSNFTNQLFTLSVGSVEAAFGLILIFGFITRLNITALTTCFLATNITFFLQGHFTEGLTELMGHLPIIASVLIFITYGSGQLFPKNH